MIYPSIQRLQQQLEQQLRSQPEGMNEHTLLRQIRVKDNNLLPHGQLHDSLALFQIHFIVFHALYQLRDQLWQQQAGHLEIGPLIIQLRPYQPNQQALRQHEPLRDYYLDLNNLEMTGEHEVNELLSAFWKRLKNNDGRKIALEELGLCDPVDDETIKKTWRQLVMQYHPDRGGEKKKIQLLNAAMDWLKKG